jgi:hypothetical protein
MKSIIRSLAAVAFLLAAIWLWADTERIITNASTSVPVELVDSAGNPFAARTFIFVGMNAAHTTNTSRVIIQRNPTNDVGGIPINPGEKVGIPVYTDRARVVRWWLDVESANDGVIVIPIQ